MTKPLFSPDDSNYALLGHLMQSFSGRQPNPVENAIAYLAFKKLAETGSHYKNEKNFTSRNYIYKWLTGREWNDNSGEMKKYMAQVTHQAIEPLVKNGILSDDSTGYVFTEETARSLQFSPTFKKYLLDNIPETVYNPLKTPTTAQKRKVDVGVRGQYKSHKTTHGDGWKKDYTRHADATNKTYDKLSASTFTVDWDRIASFDMSGLSEGQLTNIYYVLSTIERTNEEQRHKAINLTMSGRMWTDGGIMNLYRPLREQALVARDGYTLWDFDLVSAQLLLLSEYLGSDFYQTLTSMESPVWEYFGLDVPKTHMKIATYAFCYGMALKNIVSGVCNATGDTLFTQEHLDVMVAKMGDLVTRRELWFSKNSSKKIKEFVGKKKNDIGMTFSPSVNDNLPGQFLAFLMQGKEQLIMQSLIASVVDENICSFSYDGFIVEIEDGKEDEVRSKYQKYLDTHFSGQRIKGKMLT